MATLVIHIKKGFPDGRLELSDNGHTKAKRLDKIIWQIAPHSGVQSIVRFEQKPNSEDIFEPGHPHNQGGHWTGTIRGDVADYTHYRYNIYWKSSDGQEHRHDPIISIRPSSGLGDVPTLVIAFSIALLGIFSFMYWHQKKSSRQSFKF